MSNSSDMDALLQGHGYQILPLGTRIMGSNHANVLTVSVKDNNDYSSVILIVSIVLIICSAISVILRSIRSWQAQSHFEWHDAFIALAAICAIVMSSQCAHLTGDGLGTHDYNNKIAQTAHFQKLIIATNCFYFSCNFFVKLALLFMYRKFTRGFWGNFSISSMIALSFVFWAGSIVATFVECMPLHAIWDWSVTEGTCINVSAFYIANAVTMIGMDIVLYVMPVIFTWKLRLSRAKKIGLNVLFGLGCIVLTASAVRLWIVQQATTQGDLSYNYGRSLLVSQVENHVAIVIACAPAMRSVCMQGLFSVKGALYSSRSKFEKLWSHTSSSAPSSPYSDKFSEPPTPQQSEFRLPKSNKISMLGSLFSTSESKPVTQASSRDDGDLELGFHERTCEYTPTMNVSITAGGAPPRPPSQKNKIYITREITVTEEHISPSASNTQQPCSDGDAASIRSYLSSSTTDVSSIDLAALPQPSPKPSKENFTDEDGVMRKDFADIMKAHM